MAATKKLTAIGYEIHTHYQTAKKNKGMSCRRQLLSVFSNPCIYPALSLFIDGDMFLLEADSCNSNEFQAFLDHLSLRRPHELKVVILDNSAFQHAAALEIPQNSRLIYIRLIPELNTAECIWKNLKRKIYQLPMQIFQRLAESEMKHQECPGFTAFDTKRIAKTIDHSIQFSC